MCKGKGRKGKDKLYVLYDIAKTPIVRHVKVKKDNSPDNPELRKYWNDRKTKQGSKYWAKGSKNLQVAKNQNWKCPVCGQHLFNGKEVEIETHHIVAVKDGGRDSTDNLVHMHKVCHKQLHSKSKLKGLK